MHAFYSARAEELFGYCIYSRYSTFSREKENVKVTAIYDSKEKGMEDYKWEDKVYLGIMDKFESPHWNEPYYSS